MGQRKHKSIHDNISLEGLEAVFELQSTDQNQSSNSDSNLVPNSDLQSTEKNIFDEISGSLKLKANKKAIDLLSAIRAIGSVFRIVVGPSDLFQCLYHGNYRGYWHGCDHCNSFNRPYIEIQATRHATR